LASLPDEIGIGDPKPPPKGASKARRYASTDEPTLRGRKWLEQKWEPARIEARGVRTAIRDVELARQRFRALVGQRRTRSLTGG